MILISAIIPTSQYKGEMLLYFAVKVLTANPEQYVLVYRVLRDKEEENSFISQICGPAFQNKNRRLNGKQILINEVIFEIEEIAQ